MGQSGSDQVSQVGCAVSDDVDVVNSLCPRPRFKGLYGDLCEVIPFGSGGDGFAADAMAQAGEVSGAADEIPRFPWLLSGGSAV
jgi:hypothetical protein